jgi:hypothetical protein
VHGLCYLSVANGMPHCSFPTGNAMRLVPHAGASSKAGACCAGGALSHMLLYFYIRRLCMQAREGCHASAPHCSSAEAGAYSSTLLVCAA